MSTNLTVYKNTAICLLACGSVSHGATRLKGGTLHTELEAEIKVSAGLSPEAAGEGFTSRQLGWLVQGVIVIIAYSETGCPLVCVHHEETPDEQEFS